MDPSEVVNGEELEECTFKARGKLFRLSSKEWVEKGIGNLKVSKIVGKGTAGGEEEGEDEGASLGLVLTTPLTVPSMFVLVLLPLLLMLTVLSCLF